MHNSYEISHREGKTTKWGLFTGDLVKIKKIEKHEDWGWLYTLGKRVGDLAVVLGPIKRPKPGDENAYIVKFVSDGRTELVESEEVELVSRRLD